MAIFGYKRNIEKVDTSFPVSDGWFVDHTGGWFVGSFYNALFHVDLDTMEYKLICELPIKETLSIREYPICIKHNNNIFFFPTTDKENILIYDLIYEKWTFIKMENLNKGNWMFRFVYKEGSQIIAFSQGTQELYIIDADLKLIKENLSIANDRIIGLIKQENILWAVNITGNIIYSFDLIDRKSCAYELKNMDDQIYEICFDGKLFWLAGYKRKIYSWNKDTDELNILLDFPEHFGIFDKQKDTIEEKNDRAENGLFNKMIYLNGFVWCIPQHANMILKINVRTKEISQIEILNIDNTKTYLYKNELNGECLVEYVNERYIGIIFISTGRLFEIDTLKCNIIEKESQYMYSNKENSLSGIFFENDFLHSFFWIGNISDSKGNTRKKNIGSTIYNYLCKRDN